MKTNSMLLTAASCVLILASCGTKQEESVKKVDSHPPVNVVQVQKKDFTHEIRVQGNIETDQDVLISAEMGGLLTGITVKEGQKVNKGQVLATIDASVLNSNLNELETQLEYAEYMLKKQEELNKKGVGSEVDLETSRNQVAALKAKIKSLNTQKGKSVVTAPFSGVIDQVFGKDGQITGPQSPLFRLVNNNMVDVVASISEKHYAHIQVGTPIAVTFPNYSDTVINLKITNVGNYIEPTNRTIRIRSSIKGNKFLLPNMLAEVRITDLQAKDGTVIPAQSVLKDNENNDYVFIIEKGKKGDVAKKVEVNVLSRFNGECLIGDDSNLKEGDLVVTKGARGIVDNELVQAKLIKE